MTKARPVAGDLALGRDFLDAIRPFIWRRGLDFAAIADIHAMKRRINAHSAALGAGDRWRDRRARRQARPGRHPRDRVPRADPAAGLGRARPGLRDPTTLGALRRLVRAGKLPRRRRGRADGGLSLPAPGRAPAADGGRPADPRAPAKPDELARFAVFMGFAGRAAFAEALLRPSRPGAAPLRRGVRGGAGAAGPRRPASSTSAARRRAAGDRRGAARARLRATPSGIVATVRGWQAGRLRALRSRAGARADGRRCCRRCSPRSAPSRSPTSPSAASTRCSRSCRPACSCCPCSSATRRCSTASPPCSARRRRSPNISRSMPAALDGLLAPDGRPRSRAHARAPAARRAALEDAIADHAALVREEDFSHLRRPRWRAGSTPTRPGCGARRWPTPRSPPCCRAVLADYRRALRRGCAAAAMAVVALGKAGGREMMAGSDLDLMLIYDHPRRT